MSALGFLEEELLRLEMPYWVSIKRFDVLDDGADDEALLAHLIGDRQYEDHYAGGDAVDQPRHGLHGPYRLSSIAPSSFVPCPAERAHEVMCEWLSQLQPVPSDAQLLLSERVLPLLRGSISELADGRAVAEHEWGWVVGVGGFHEFVVVDRSEHCLVLIVASDD